MSESRQTRHWCFTSFDVTLKPEHVKDYTYIVYGEEVCPTTLRPHLQGYVCFKKLKRKTGVIKLFQANWTACDGSPSQNREYCTKGGQFREFGILPLSGGQTEVYRWSRIHELAKEKNFSSFLSEFPHESFKFDRNFDRLQTRYRVPQPIFHLHPILKWYVGPTGSGKSRTVREEYKTFYLKACTKWWDGYDDEEVVVIDDLGKTHGYMLEYLKTWADHYEFSAECKGGHKTKINPKIFIITTQYMISELTEDYELQEAIRRRVGDNLVVFPKSNPRAPQGTEGQIEKYLSNE